MKISKSSWHYNLVEWLWTSPARSLCGYFWQLVFVLILAFIIASFVVYTVFSMLFFWCFNKEVFVFMWGIGWDILALVVALCIGVAFLMEVYHSRPSYTRRRRKKYILFEWMRAIKGRICPIITFVDKD